jgi:predicted MFS family arabinose efflux permease
MTGHFGWRSVFFINLPLGLAALGIVWRFLPRVVHADKFEGKAIDWLGVVVLTLSIGILLLTLEFAERLGFASFKFWGAVGGSIVLAIAFVRHQRRSSAPIIPPELFSSPAVRRLSLLATLTGFCMFVLVFYAPLMLQAGFSLSPEEAGLLVTPIMVCVTLGSIINGRLIPRMEKPERLFSMGGLLLMPAMAMLCLVSSETPHLLMLGLFALCGFAFGFQLPNLTIQMQASVERKHVGAASALIQTLRTMGSMFGASLAGLVVSIVFARGAAVVLAEGGINQPQVQQLFQTPQVLLRTGEQEILSQMGTRFGFDAATLVEQARLSLVHGIRGAFVLCLLLAIVAYYLGRKLPPFVHQGRD